MANMIHLFVVIASMHLHGYKMLKNIWEFANIH